ncbi:MAG: polysaccharide deacetylase family protein [Vicinamibacterales bacterium]
MKLLTIGIDPQLAAFRPEISWIWRALLTGMGLGWTEVEAGAAPCDLAYVVDPRAATAPIIVRAEIAKWRDPGAQVIQEVSRSGGRPHPRFVDDTVGPSFAAHDGRLVCHRDIIFDAFWLAAGVPERRWPKGPHGIFDLDQEPAVGQGLFRDGLASDVGCALEQVVRDRLGLEGEPRWPNGKRMAACVGHDVDYPEVYHVLEPLRVVMRQGLKGVSAACAVGTGLRHHWHFQSWTAFEQSVGLRSAFYFVPRRGSLLERVMGTPDPFYDIRHDKFRRLFRELRESGVEIGLHASYLAYAEEDGIQREKQAVEAAAGVTVHGNRHHYWHLNPEHPTETLRRHERAGLLYDASLFHDRYVGWRRGLTWPYFPYDAERRRPIGTLQIPTGWMDDQLFGLKAHNPGAPTDILDDVIARVAAQRGCFMIDVHEYVYDEALFPGWADAYRYAIRQMVDRGDVWFATPAELARHWCTRSETLAAASRGLDGARVPHAPPVRA